MAVLSTNNATLTILVANALPIKVENFDPNSDMWSVDDLQTADGEVTPDGQFNHWAINGAIQCTLNLSGGSKTSKKLEFLLNNQQRVGQSLSYIPEVSVVVTLNGETETYVGGILKQGKAGRSLGYPKINPTAWVFLFPRKV